jgi:hypothetical protein
MTGRSTTPRRGLGAHSFTVPVAVPTRRTAADVKAGRRPPEGLGLDTGENRRTIGGHGNGQNNLNSLTRITHIMPMCACCVRLCDHLRPWMSAWCSSTSN